ncbi:nucleic acid-binding protein [Natronococcus pandeyae]|uniref:Nucleic acid-binding protein n=1 Tax=Natronococcus pandeyae TaxID=2055836 RepID=A0A8J8TQC6_9EURY|nr:nucleic acid-binding protein [Natronococcus pandeyae]TYL36594.1 nucleic acid-binding protein [Natronococcus pandeyae]
MTMEATRYDDGTISYPGHPRSRNGAEPVETIDLSEHTAEVVTWTTSMATPPGVREPNHLAIVEFDIGDAVDDGEESVRALVQLTTGDVETGDDVRPVYAEELREPGAGIREPESQDWGGYRFEPV